MLGWVYRRVFSLGRPVVEEGRPWPICGLSLEMFQPEINFSAAGTAVSRLRLWLSPVYVDMIPFLRKNYHDIDSYAWR